jgi:hypothetical protein
MTELHPGSLVFLVRSVGVLTLPYEGQISWLESLGLGQPFHVDELALELGDGEPQHSPVWEQLRQLALRALLAL